MSDLAAGEPPVRRRSLSGFPGGPTLLGPAGFLAGLFRLFVRLFVRPGGRRRSRRLPDPRFQQRTHGSGRCPPIAAGHTRNPGHDGRGTRPGRGEEPRPGTRVRRPATTPRRPFPPFTGTRMPRPCTRGAGRPGRSHGPSHPNHPRHAGYSPHAHPSRHRCPIRRVTAPMVLGLRRRVLQQAPGRQPLARQHDDQGFGYEAARGLDFTGGRESAPEVVDLQAASGPHGGLCHQRGVLGGDFVERPLVLVPGPGGRRMVVLQCHTDGMPHACFP